jgi:hypothetical protein
MLHAVNEINIKLDVKVLRYISNPQWKKAFTEITSDTVSHADGQQQFLIGRAA